MINNFTSTRPIKAVFLSFFFCSALVFLLLSIAIPGQIAEINSLLEENKLYGAELTYSPVEQITYFSQDDLTSPKNTLFTFTGSNVDAFVDITNHKRYYFTGFSYESNPPLGRIFRSNLDGSEMEEGRDPQIANRPYQYLIPVDFDASRGHIYYVTGYGLHIVRSKFDGTDARIVLNFDTSRNLASTILSNSSVKLNNGAISFDFVRDKMYFVTDGSGSSRFELNSAKLDGTNLQRMPLGSAFDLNALFVENSNITLTSNGLDIISGDYFLGGRKFPGNNRLYRFKVAQWQPGNNVEVEPFAISPADISLIDPLQRRILIWDETFHDTPPLYFRTTSLRYYTLDGTPQLMVDYGDMEAPDDRSLPYFSHCDPRFLAMADSFPRNFLDALRNSECNVTAPVIETQPQSQTIAVGASASFTVNATGQLLSYQWKKNGVDISGATASSYRTPVCAIADSGSLYSVLVSNAAGSITSNAARLTVTPSAPVITTQPIPITVIAGRRATFSVVAAGTGLTYQWRKNGVNISGATASSYRTPVTVVADSSSLYSVVVVNAGGSVTSNSARLTVNAAVPSITVQPASTAAIAGQTATFSVTAIGGSLTFQWKKNGVNISGATRDVYTTPVTVTADLGAQYSVVISNSLGTVASSAARLTVNTAAPSITTQPISAAAIAGQRREFSVVAIGGNLTYQWRKNAVNISGATSSTYKTPVTTTAISGSQYSVVITNSQGSIISSVAILTVNNAAPSIIVQPISITAIPGQTATFSATAIGGSLTFQWKKNGINISGATGDVYTTPVTITADSGAQYSVVISNSLGSVRSSSAALTVN